jgi:hypothetical protein
MKNNYDEYIRVGKEALSRIDYLTQADQKRIERGIWHMECGKALLASNNPEELREAASRLTAGAAYIMSVTGVSDSEAEYWRRKACSRGGSKTRPETEEWRRWVLEKVTKYHDVKTTALAQSLLVEKARPYNLPGEDTIKRFIRERRKIATSKSPVRLVHSA